MIENRLHQISSRGRKESLSVLRITVSFGASSASHEKSKSAKVLRVKYPEVGAFVRAIWFNVSRKKGNI